MELGNKRIKGKNEGGNIVYFALKMPKHYGPKQKKNIAQIEM